MEKFDLDKVMKLMSDEESLSSVRNYVETQQQYASAIREVRTKLEVLNDEFAVKHDHNPIHSIESRLKSPKSIIKKLKKKGLEFSMENARKHLYDIAGIRVICGYIDDIYNIAEILTNQNDITLLNTKDYIKNPKPNGYRSLHLVLTVPIFLSGGPVSIPVEIQIRTVAMDFWASLEHELRYKTKNEIPEDVHKELYDCASLIASLDERMQKIFRKVQAEPSENKLHFSSTN